MSKTSQGVAVLMAALVVGVVAQSIARQEAAFLGLTALELALLGAGVSAVARRQGLI